MFSHFLKLSIRRFRQNKTSFFINLVGLTTGLASALFIFLWVMEELNMDNFHEHREHFAGLAVIISCLGLLGLSIFTGETRRKEIGIRKVLGASISGIVVLLTKDFSRSVGIAILLGENAAFTIKPSI